MNNTAAAKSVRVSQLKAGDREASYPHPVEAVRSWEHPKLGTVVTVSYTDGCGSTRQARIRTAVER